MYVWQVVVQSKPFNKVSREEGLKLLGVTGPTAAHATNLVAAFAADPLVESEKLPSEIQNRTQWKTVGDVLQHLSNDLACRAYVARSHESGKRELVAPFLMAAAAIVFGIQVHAEFGVDGTAAHGFVDWVMLYYGFCIVVVEVSCFK